MTTATVPVTLDDPTNAAILAVSEDRVAGFREDPFGAIAEASGIDVETVLERMRAMLRGGDDPPRPADADGDEPRAGRAGGVGGGARAARRGVRYMSKDDPFSGHVVIRSTDGDTPGSRYRLWTTLKVPQGYSHAKGTATLLAGRVGATAYRIMPAKRLFALGVGHVRRRRLEPGSALGGARRRCIDTDDRRAERASSGRCSTALKREFDADEVQRDIWRARAAEAGVTPRRVPRRGARSCRRAA